MRLATTTNDRIPERFPPVATIPIGTARDIEILVSEHGTGVASIPGCQIAPIFYFGIGGITIAVRDIDSERKLHPVDTLAITWWNSIELQREAIRSNQILLRRDFKKHRQIQNILTTTLCGKPIVCITRIVAI